MGGPRRRDGAQEASWALEVEHRARPDLIVKPEEALDGYGSSRPQLSQLAPKLEGSAQAAGDWSVHGGR